MLYLRIFFPPLEWKFHGCIFIRTLEGEEGEKGEEEGGEGRRGREEEGGEEMESKKINDN